MSIVKPVDRSLLITDIGELVAVPPGPLTGAAMGAVPLLRNAALLIRDGKIAWLGAQTDAPLDEGVATLSAEGGCVIPGLIDPHTHIPFAGERSGEFVRRVTGESYLQIMQAGGGIRTTTQAVRRASVADLVAENQPRLRRMLACGVTRVECKSGYGLTPEDELKQLEAIRLLDQQTPQDLDATYLGAHAVPAEFDGRADEYIERMSAPELLAEIAGRSLARFCDVFCDRGAFDVSQSRRYLIRAAQAGLRPKLHADELASIGATRLAGEVGAISADHLECIDEDGITALRTAGTIAVVLPGTSFFLGIPHCDARRLMDAGLAVALATDFNPGSCMLESLPWIMTIACCQLRMQPLEVLVACTANAAAALDVHWRTGALVPGYDADVVVLAAPTLAQWFYTAGRPRVRAVIKSGQIVHRDPHAE